MTVELTPAAEGCLSALPTSAEFLRQMDVVEIVDELYLIREVAHLTHGQAVQAPRVVALVWASAGFECGHSTEPAPAVAA
jgi:hypothetical protein